MRAWIRELEKEAAFRIEWAEIDHRILGRNRIPSHVVIEQRADALHVIGRCEDAARFERLAETTARRMPELREWLMRKPLRALESFADWERILSVVEWFREHPKSGLYLRQLDICGVDTKFIEERKPLLAELLDLIMAPVDCAPGPRWFERRYGLAVKPLQIRFRILDRELAIGGLTDLTVTLPELAGLGFGGETDLYHRERSERARFSRDGR